MRVNEKIGELSCLFTVPHLVTSKDQRSKIEGLTIQAIATKTVLLVPYEAHHVPRYHSWMQDAAIREATASEELTLEEEFENQQSWRSSHDKLTFILCLPVPTSTSSITAGEQDSNARMIGDVNFFLYPHEDDEGRGVLLRGEVDVMVAESQARGRGAGVAAVRALLAFVGRHLASILGEYATAHKEEQVGKENGSKGEAASGETRLAGLMVKIKESNESSIRLFRGLGFTQDGGVDYFGEVKMVLPWRETARFGGDEALSSLGYRELGYTSDT